MLVLLFTVCKKSNCQLNARWLSPPIFYFLKKSLMKEFETFFKAGGRLMFVAGFERELSESGPFVGIGRSQVSSDQSKLERFLVLAFNVNTT